MASISKAARRRAVGWLLATAWTLLALSRPVRQLCELPDALGLTRGYARALSFALPVRARTDGGLCVSVAGDESLPGVVLSGEDVGKAEVTFSLLGLLPFKKVEVTVAPERVVVPAGQTVGVAMTLSGVLIVGASDLKGGATSPARAAGLKAGDIIEEVDGTRVGSVGDLAALIADGERKLLTVLRAGNRLALEAQPEIDERDGKYRLGAWVRDGTAGVGTLTFYDPLTGGFAALGHAVCDVDTGVTLPLGDGEIARGDVIGVRKGARGTPGELVSEVAGGMSLGEIEINGELGIYGSCYAPLESALYPEGVAVMARSEVQLGAAELIASIDGGAPEKYSCEIVKLADQGAPTQRGITVRVTDTRLLAATGGIVQGMSGSPILQNGRLAGAVTHVYVSDPAMGYGVYAEWMLESLDEIRAADGEGANIDMAG